MYVGFTIGCCLLFCASTSFGKSIHVKVEVNVEGLPTSKPEVHAEKSANLDPPPSVMSASDDRAPVVSSSGDSEHEAFVKKIVELKHQALRIMALRGKKVDPKGNVTSSASWGDIQLNEKMYNALKKNFDEEEKRLTSKNETDRMAAPDFKLIPYNKWPREPIKYTTNLVNDKKKLELLDEAVKTLQSKSCLRFSHVKSATGPHIEFNEMKMDPGTCADSPLGMQAEKNVINIDIECVEAGTYVHEILHTLGFAHTQSRLDAEQYIKINYDNIVEDAKYNFKPWAYALANQGSYDYASIMQYGRFAFAIDEKIPTLEPKISPEVNRELMGEREHMSKEDVRLLNKIYCEDVDTKIGKCVDKTADCEFWAGQGMCETDDNTKEKCEYSCKKCTRDSPTSEPEHDTSEAVPIATPAVAGDSGPEAVSEESKEDFVHKVVELKKQALRLMKLRGKNVDPHGNVTSDASWGDVQLNEKMYNAMKRNFDEEEKRLTSKNETDRMAAPDFRLIPYQKWPAEPIKYTTHLVTDKNKLPLIEEALQEISANSCLKFTHVKSAEGPHIEFKETSLNPAVCADSPLGMQPDKNEINIQTTCVEAGTYLHETLHSLGFSHTQERPDAEQYIKFNFDNMLEEFKPFFKPLPYGLTNQGPYDYGSIMHYDQFAFATDKTIPTMEAKKDPEVNNQLMGVRDHMSKEDVRVLNKIYCEDTSIPDKSGCIDKSANCMDYARQGVCDTDDYTKENCDFSCKRCTRDED